MAPSIRTITVGDIRVTVQDIVKTLNIVSESVLGTLKCQNDYCKVCTKLTPHILIRAFLVLF